MSKRKVKEEELQQMEENELVSYLEEKAGHLKPYWGQITLGICIAILALLGGVFLWDQGNQTEAATWQMLNIGKNNLDRTDDNNSLLDFANQYPDHPAGLWALLYTADSEMRGGLSELGNDREAGFEKIKKAQGLYKQIVDSSTKKTPLLQRRSSYGLAYAYESSGDFEQAEPLYQSLVDAGEDNPLFKVANEGLTRVQSDDMKSFFAKFQEFVPATAEEAPGARLPKRPDISFPSAAAQPNSGGGEFGSEASADATGESADTAGE